MLLRRSPLFPRLQGHKEKAVIGGTDTTQQAESGDGRDSLHSRRFSKDVLDLFASGVGSLQRCRFRQRQISVKITLILGRNKSLWDLPAQPAGRQQNQHQKQNAKEAAPHQKMADAYIAISRGSEDFVKSVKEKCQWPPARFFFWPQEKRGKRRTQCQRVECREDH